MRLQLYLASRSPRRQELLRQLGLRFEILPVDVAEQPRPGQSPAEYAVSLAQAKARAAAGVIEKELLSPGRGHCEDQNAPGTRTECSALALGAAPLPVLGADTDVVLDGEILGKPAGREHGLAMLAKLSGRMHEVYSAVAVVRQDREQTALSVTRVRFASITPAMAAAYWDTGEPVDKAGAYAIQGLGARFVKSIEGSYSGVMGLPLYETCEILRGFGVEIFPSPEAPGASAGDFGSSNGRRPSPVL